jgi:hypothetical protein
MTEKWRSCVRFGTLTLTLVLGAVLLAPSARAEHEDPCREAEGALSLQTQQTYVKASATNVGNLAALGADWFPTWNTQVPSQDATGGA